MKRSILKRIGYWPGVILTTVITIVISVAITTAVYELLLGTPPSTISLSIAITCPAILSPIIAGISFRYLITIEDLVRALRAKNDEISQAKQEVEMASQAKSRFFAAASHDLRQPLYALSLLTGTLENHVNQEKALSTLKQMKSALASLETLFNDALNIAKLESGKIDLCFTTLSPDILFEQLEHKFAPFAESKRLRLHFHWHILVLHTDVQLLERILSNLISNAIKYTDNGGVLVTCRRSAGRAKIQVFDTGIGIASDELPYIFEDFYKVASHNSARGAQRDGVGLGLGIAKRLTELLGYSIDVRSQPGKGTVFTLYVPMATSLDTPNTAMPRQTHDTKNISLAGETVLVVDDDTMVVDALETLLSDWGARVIKATSSATLQQALSAMSQAPNFMIADYQLEPGFTGEDALLNVREHFGRTIPCIVVTGNLSLVPERVARLPKTRVFAKPVDNMTLGTLLHNDL